MRNPIATLAASVLFVGTSIHHFWPEAPHDAGVTYEVDSRLTVTGMPDAVQRFVALEHHRFPALTMSPSVPMVGDKAVATVSFPTSFTGSEVVRTTEEALAAGLGYSISMRQRERR